ncbi:MAG: RDD family protein [Myxococcaceae bacterium]
MLDQRLDVATPDRVALKLPIAGIGYRTLAYLADALAMFAVWLVLYFATSFLTNLWDAFKALSGLWQAIAVFGVFAAQWCYWTACEIFGNGQTLGKKLLGIRVVRVDGSPITPLESVLRNLLRFVDFLPLLYAAGTITMLLTRDNRRIGDLVAGTLLVREERIDLARYAVAPIITSAPMISSQQLSPEEQELLLSFLQRATQLDPSARERLARKFVQHFGRQLDEASRTAVLASVHSAEAFLRQLSEQQSRT